MKQTKAKKTKNGAKRAADTAQPPAKLWANHLAKSLLISLSTGLALLLIGTTIAYFTPNPSDWVAWLGFLAALITATVCGYSMAKLHGHAALLCGLYAGSACMLVLLLISLFFKEHASGYVAWLSCLLHAGFVLCAVVGASIGIRPPKKRKKR